jgi:hypothetical protein
MGAGDLADSDREAAEAVEKAYSRRSADGYSTGDSGPGT